ncbi:MAG: 5-hydroxyisourate hydrolase [Granulosicoccus sp.]
MKPMITTHILDTSRGRPAGAVTVNLYRDSDVHLSNPIATGVTDVDGRVTQWDRNVERLAGSYRLEFDVDSYFSGIGESSFYSDIQIAFKVVDDAEHYHVPLLLNPFGYSTYRGS